MHPNLLPLIQISHVKGVSEPQEERHRGCCLVLRMQSRISDKRSPSVNLVNSSAPNLPDPGNLRVSCGSQWHCSYWSQ
ncbi:hypothetical protein Y1Q_0006838 [Alligator mississippiensis]|uniref:Uncharacterized protein n=1 Tax=Alligator mississippiensis TaxID=8496 RepID=A0A151M5T0_ALLMI|nr:hypothetical protein Y1Q_0006838 [Alligator mississippiensis]